MGDEGSSTAWSVVGVRTGKNDLKLPVGKEPEIGAMSEEFAIGHWLTVVIDQDGKVAFQDTGKWGEAKLAVRKILGKDSRE